MVGIFGCFVGEFQFFGIMFVLDELFQVEMFEFGMFDFVWLCYGQDEDGYVGVKFDYLFVVGVDFFLGENCIVFGKVGFFGYNWYGLEGWLENVVYQVLDLFWCIVMVVVDGLVQFNWVVWVVYVDDLYF